MFNICFLQKEINSSSEALRFFERLSKQEFIKSYAIFTDRCDISIDCPIFHTYYIRHLFFPKLILIGDHSNNYDMYQKYGSLWLLDKKTLQNNDIENFLKDKYNEYSV